MSDKTPELPDVCPACGALPIDWAQRPTAVEEVPVSAQKLILFCDRQLAALDVLRREVEGMKRAAQSLIDRRAAK